MKKVLYFMSIVAIILLTGCSKSNLESLSLSELHDKLNNKESFILYIDDNNSSLKNKLEKVLSDNNITGYSIKSSKISNEEKIKLEPNISFDDTTIVFIIEGNDPSRLSHITDEDITTKEIESRLKDMNFIKSNN